MTETLIKNFAQISKTDTEIAGGKGASLGEMTQVGIPVPEGFVILSNAFDRFLEETDLNVEIDAVLDTVDIKEIHTVENASEKIKAMILSKEMPEDIKAEILKFYKNLDCKFVAVRSSATSEDSVSAAWAGQLDSFLNTTDETLLENVKKCWASLFTPRAIFYRFENKLNKDKISVAVVVQKMVDSEESGIAFSVHPVTQDENQIIIEAGFGLGEAIVSGSITPDSYIADKRGFKILDINVNEQTKALYRKAKGGNKWKELGEKGKKQVLTEKEIIELSKLIVKIENHYGFPCDIEWAKEQEKFYIVQSRPITTLINKNSSHEVGLPLEIKKSVWVKNWSSNWKTAFASLYWLYTKNLAPYGNNLSTNAVVCEKKVSSNYIAKNELDKYCNDLVQRIVKDESFAERIAQDTITTAEKLHSVFKIFQETKNINLKNLLQLKKLFYIHIPPHVAMKKVIDYLPENLKEKFSPSFTKARVVTEKLDLFNTTDNILRSYSNFIARKTSYSQNSTEFLTIEEMIEFLKNNILPQEQELKERSKGLVIFYEGNKSTFLTNARYRAFMDLLVNRYKSDINGNTAYGGVARGIARVVFDPRTVRKFNKGDVLVTGMTRPEFLPLMKKASAFITDAGGLLSHAAIVARELKKPCILATEIATKVIKDGDLVEVNADKGMVRILKKK